jgi:DNA primase
MAFPTEFLDELRRRVTLSSLISRRVKLQRRGQEHTGLCPFHKEKTPSFTVSDAKGFYHCFGCGAHGDVIGFVIETEGLSFPEAVAKLAGEAGLELPRRDPAERERDTRRNSLVEVMEAAAAWFRDRLHDGAGAPARDYLATRGLLPATIESFALGFAPSERGALGQALEKQGFPPALMAEAGLVKLAEEGAGTGPRDYFFNRLIFPITDRRGRVIAFGGRTMGESKAKYINSPESPLFHKGRVLYNHAGALRAVRDNGELIVVEGYMDVIALAQAGFQAAVAPLGTAVTEEQIAELWRMVPEPVLCLDGDNAGRRAAFRAAERALGGIEPGNSLRFAFLPEGEDPDSLILAEGAGALREILDRAIALVDLLWLKETQGRDFSTPERRAGLRRDLRRAVRELPDRELAADYLDELMARYERAFPRRSGGRRQYEGAGPSGSASRPYGPASTWRTSGPQGGPGGGGRASPASPPVSGRPDPERRMRRRCEQLLLALLINHPWLLEEQAETIATLDLRSKDLLPMLDEIIDAFVSRSAEPPGGPNSSRPILDSDGLKCHLRDKGYAGVLEELFSPDVLIHGKFARADASEEAARRGLVHLKEGIRQQASLLESEDAVRALAEDMTEEALLRLRAHQQLSANNGPEEDRAEGVSVLDSSGRKQGRN